MIENEETNAEVSSPTDATMHYIYYTDEELNTMLARFDGAYNLMVFWFIAWASLRVLSSIRNSFLKSTKGVKD